MPDPNRKLYTEVVNVPCSTVDKAMIQQLATDNDEPMSKTIRDLIKSAHQMQFGNLPTCATGQQCLCAQMHQLRVRSNATDEERVLQANQRLNPDEYLEQ